MAVLLVAAVATVAVRRRRHRARAAMSARAEAEAVASVAGVLFHEPELTWDEDIGLGVSTEA